MAGGSLVRQRLADIAPIAHLACTSQSQPRPRLVPACRIARVYLSNGLENRSEPSTMPERALLSALWSRSWMLSPSRSLPQRGIQQISGRFDHLIRCDIDKAGMVSFGANAFEARRTWYFSG